MKKKSFIVYFIREDSRGHLIISGTDCSWHTLAEKAQEFLGKDTVITGIDKLDV